MAEDETRQKLGVVAKESIQCFEGETSRVQQEVASAQQSEIQSLMNAIEHLKQQKGMSMWNIETASSSNALELKTTVAGLQHEVAAEHV